MIFETNIEDKWLEVKRYASKMCDAIAFNVLYECSEYFDFLEENKGDILSTGMGFEKEYASGQSILFSYTEKMKFLMEEKSFEYFMNFFIEDPSFFIDGKEVISTITHENYIIFADDFQDSEYFRTKGFFLEKEKP